MPETSQQWQYVRTGYTRSCPICVPVTKVSIAKSSASLWCLGIPGTGKAILEECAPGHWYPGRLPVLGKVQTSCQEVLQGWLSLSRWAPKDHCSVVTASHRARYCDYCAFSSFRSVWWHTLPWVSLMLCWTKDKHFWCQWTVPLALLRPLPTVSSSGRVEVQGEANAFDHILGI